MDPGATPPCFLVALRGSCILDERRPIPARSLPSMSDHVQTVALGRVRRLARRCIPAPVRRVLVRTVLGVSRARTGCTSPSSNSRRRPEYIGFAEPRLSLRPDRSLLRSGLHLVLTMPKVGSVTLRKTVSNLPVGGHFESFHTFGLQTYYSDPSLLLHNPEAPNSPVHRIWRAGKLAAMIEAVREQREWALQVGAAPPPKPCIVTAVREPVARTLSHIFWHCHHFRGPGIPIRIGATDAASILEGLRPFPYDEPARAWWRRDPWFDANLRDVFGVDVFAEPFDAERGWTVYEKEHARVLLVRMESFARLREALATFYGIQTDDVRVVHSNRSEEFAYSDQYEAVKRDLNLSSGLLDEIYESRFVRHFYTDDEVAAFKARWSESRSAASGVGR